MKEEKKKRGRKLGGKGLYVRSDGRAPSWRRKQTKTEGAMDHRGDIESANRNGRNSIAKIKQINV